MAGVVTSLEPSSSFNCLSSSFMPPINFGPSNNDHLSSISEKFYFTSFDLPNFLINVMSCFMAFGSSSVSSSSSGSSSSGGCVVVVVVVDVVVELSFELAVVVLLFGVVAAVVVFSDDFLLQITLRL